MLDEVCVCGEEQVVQLVHTHPDGGVDVQPSAQVRAERFYFTWMSEERHVRLNIYPCPNVNHSVERKHAAASPSLLKS